MEFAKKLLFLFCMLITLLKAMEIDKNPDTPTFPKMSVQPLLSTQLPENTVIQSKFSNTDYQNELRKEFNNLKITITCDKQWYHINVGKLEDLIGDQINQKVLDTKEENKQLLKKLVELQKISGTTYYPKTTFLLGALTGSAAFAFCAYCIYQNKITSCKYPR